VAGNANSGNALPFRLTETELANKIKTFREEYGQGQNGMVSWPMFCDYLGYSETDVRDCYLRGIEGKNAYNGRARLLESFRTAIKGLTLATCNKQQQLALKEINTDYLAIPGQEDKAPEVRIIFGNGDDRWVDAMK
jgi:hypothetical protein